MTNDEIYITHPVTGESMDKSMCKRVITQLYEQREALEKQIDGLHDQIMNLQALDQPGVERNSQIAYKTGHRDARHAAAELVAMIEAETKNESPAIERDIPVQPKLITATREDFDDTFECPSCAKRFSSFDEFDFCPWCGQRLDWSE